MSIAVPMWAYLMATIAMLYACGRIVQTTTKDIIQARAIRHRFNRQRQPLLDKRAEAESIRVDNPYRDIAEFRIRQIDEELAGLDEEESIALAKVGL